MERSKVKLGMEALVPAWVFEPLKDHGRDTTPVRVRVDKVVKRWQGDPSVVVISATGKETTVNVYYLEPVPREAQDE